MDFVARSLSARLFAEVLVKLASDCFLRGRFAPVSGLWRGVYAGRVEHEADESLVVDVDFESAESELDFFRLSPGRTNAS